MTWRDVIRPRDRRAEIDEEIASHLRMATEDRIDRGELPDEARLAARREFGNTRLVREDTRAIWSWTRAEQLLQDLRLGARILTTAPALSLTAIALIALVIGGNTTVFSMVHGLLTKPADGVRAERLVVFAVAGRPGANMFSHPEYLDYASQTRTLQSLVALTYERITLGVEHGNYAVVGMPVSRNYFSVFGVSLARGQGFAPSPRHADEAGLTAVVSHRIWQEQYHGADDVVGRAITVNGLAATIVGVAAQGFRGAFLQDSADLWIPIESYYRVRGMERDLADRSDPRFMLAGTLGPGVALADAETEVATIGRRLEIDYPTFNRAKRVGLAPYFITATSVFADRATVLLAIFSIVTLLTLVIVSANVANLMLARAVARQRETAVRQSLGASQARIVCMLLAEGLTVSLAAWMAACLIALLVSQVVVAFIPPNGQGVRLNPDFTPDWRVAGYAMILAVAATLAFTLAPAVGSWRQDVLPLLKSGEQSVARGRSTISSVLVVLQLAFSVLLLTSAGLAYRTTSLIDAIDVGFDKHKLLLTMIHAGESVTNKAENAALLERLRARLQALPGVEAVSYVRSLPGTFGPAEYAVRRDQAQEPVRVRRVTVGPDYLRTLGVRPLVGRDTTAEDGPAARGVALVNRNLAELLWPGRSVIGQMLLVGREAREVEIVGVTPNALFEGFRTEDRPLYIIVPGQQEAATMVQPTFYVRHAGSVETIGPAMGDAIRDVDAKLPLILVRTLEQQLEGALDPLHLVTTLLAIFAAISLLIAAIGQYAVIAFDMRRRTRELGVRIALGASRPQILASVLKDGFTWTALGLLLGFALSAAAAGALRHLLFGVSPTDGRTFLGVVAVLAAASLLACYLPARHAARVNPMEALRQE